MAVSIAAVSRTVAVGCSAAASIEVVHTGCIEEAVGDKDGQFRIPGSPPPPGKRGGGFTPASVEFQITTSGSANTFLSHRSLHHTTNACLQYLRLSLFTGFPASSTRPSITDKNSCAARPDFSRASERVMQLILK